MENKLLVARSQGRGWGEGGQVSKGDLRHPLQMELFCLMTEVVDTRTYTCDKTAELNTHTNTCENGYR